MKENLLLKKLLMSQKSKENKSYRKCTITTKPVK